MRIYLDTSLEAIFNKGLISQRTLNCLRYARLYTMEDVLKYADKPWDLMNISNFGRKSLTEIEPLMTQVIENYSAQSSGMAGLIFDTLDENVAKVLSEAYEQVPVISNRINRYFKSIYPSVVELHGTVEEGATALLKVHSQFSMQENVEIRRIVANYLECAIRIMDYDSLTEDETYNEYKEASAEVKSKLEYINYEDKVKYYMAEDVKLFFNTHYTKLREKLSVRARNFLNKYAPDFSILALYFEAPMSDYRKMCPGQNMKQTLCEIYDFNQELRAEFDLYWQMEGKELNLAVMQYSYPFLNNDERQFVNDYTFEYGSQPMFYLLYKYMCTSDARSDSIYRQLYGFLDGRERTMNELGEEVGLTRERVRQLITRRMEVHDTDLFNNADWQYYAALLSLPFITCETDEYLQIEEHEKIGKGFRLFARLMQLLGDHDFQIEVETKDGKMDVIRIGNQYETETIGDVTVVINRRMLPSIRVKDSVEYLNHAISSRYTRDTYIDVSDSLGMMSKDERKHAGNLMAYIAKAALGLKVNGNGQILMQKNHVDVFEEIYNILESKGEPMTVDEIFKTFKALYPEHKYTDSSQIRPWLFRHEHIKAIGNTSRYGLDCWDNIFYGTIRDLLVDILSKSDTPVHLQQLLESVKEHYPNTHIKSVEALLDDKHVRFVRFNGDYYGLTSKTYDDSFTEAIVRHRTSVKSQ